MSVMDFPSSPINGQQTTDGRYYFDSSVGSTGAWRSTPLPVGGLPAGSIMAWGTNTPPANWLIADGSAVSRSTYSSLFAVIGTQYGSGNGTTTFNLPDIPAGDAAGIVGSVRLNSQVTLTATNADLPGLSLNVNFKAGRIYKISFSSPNLNASATSRARFDFVVNGVLIDRHYVGLTAGSGGVAFNIPTLYSPASDGTMTVKIQGMNDTASNTMTVYGDGNSSTFLIVEDMGEAVSSSLRQRYIIKASAGWTAGDSELATRLGAVETAQATTNRSGLVPVAPSSIAVSSGSGSANAAGLVSFSGAGTVTLNNIFTSAYRNYRIVVNVGSLTAASSGINFRYRSAGVDENTNFYFQGALLHRAAGTTANYTTQNDSLNYLVGVNVTGNPASIILDVQNPQLSIKTTGLFNASGWDAGSPTAFIGTTLNNQNKSFDGFTLICPTGTMTDGSVQVYGYR